MRIKKPITAPFLHTLRLIILAACFASLAASLAAQSDFPPLPEQVRSVLPTKTDISWSTNTLRDIENTFIQQGWILEEETLLLMPSAEGTSVSFSQPSWLGGKDLDAAACSDKLPLKELPGEPLLDISKTPQKRIWWKYPIYALTGCPRDCIDALFGAAGKVPLFGMAITGGFYELVPTQVLFRNWNDLHRWPGLRNKNAHGWIDSESWGFFSNSQNTRFKEDNLIEKKRREKQNLGILERLKSANVSIAEGNKEAARKRDILQAKALQAFKQRDFREAARLLDFLIKVDPLNQTARALYAASLLGLPRDADSMEWRKKTLSRLMQTRSQASLLEIREILRSLAANAEDANAAYSAQTYLVWVEARLQNIQGAKDAAKKLQ